MNAYVDVRNRKSLKVEGSRKVIGSNKVMASVGRNGHGDTTLIVLSLSDPVWYPGFRKIYFKDTVREKNVLMEVVPNSDAALKELEKITGNNYTISDEDKIDSISIPYYAKSLF